MGDLRDGSYIDEVKRGIGRRFEEKSAGARTHGALPGGNVAAVDERRGNAEARTKVLHDVAARAKQRACGHDVVAGLEKAEQRCGDRGHARRRGPRRASALQQTHALLEHGDGGVGVAAIDEATLALETLLGFLGRSVDIALGEEERLGGLAKGGAQTAAVHEARFEAPISLLLRILRLLAHARTPWPGGCQATKNRPNLLPLATSRAPFGRSSRAAF